MLATELINVNINKLGFGVLVFFSLLRQSTLF